LDLGKTIKHDQLGCMNQVGDFIHALLFIDELWTDDGTWAGMPFEKRYAL
jgi:hypothetical protein